MTAPDPATTGPDIIEAAVLNVVTKGEGYPVQLCSPDRAHQHRSVACPSRGKRPLSPGWAAMSKESTMPDLGKWLDGGYNIGIVLDGDLVGLDEDVPGGLDTFFRALGEPIPTTMGDIVPITGKRHLIARLHPDFDHSRLRGTWYSPEGKSLGELVHHRNKQLVAPGCAWSNSDGTQKDWRVWNQIDEFAVLSLAACEALVPPGGSFSYGSSITPPIGGNGREVESDWLWDESLGSRHDLLRDHAREMRGNTSDPVEISELTWQWGIKHGLTGVHPSSQREVTYEEVMDLAFGAVHKFQPDLKLVGIPRIERKERPPEEIRREAENIAATSEFIVVSKAAISPTAKDWLIRDLLRPKGIVVLAGEEGLGKTHVRTELALRLASGVGPMFGEYKVERTAKVLLFDEENGEDLEYEREDDILDTIGVSRVSLGENYLRGSFMGTDISTPEGQALFEAHIAKQEPDVVFVDTGGLVLTEEWGREFISAMKFARKVSETYAVVIVFIVHMVKPNRDDKAPPKQGRSITEIMGHWSRTADATWQMSPDPDDRDKAIWEVRKRWGSSRYVIEKQDNIWVAVKGLNVARAVAEATAETAILGALMSGSKKVEGVGGLIDWGDKVGKPLSKATAYRRLKAMSADGLVESNADGEWNATLAGRDLFKSTTLSIVLDAADTEDETESGGD